MFDCPDHMLFDGTHGNAQAGADFLIFLALDPVEEEYLPRALGQVHEGAHGSLESFAARDMAVRIQVCAAMMVGIEGYMIIGGSRATVTQSVGKNAGGRLEDIAADMLDRLVAPARHNARKHVLDEVIDLTAVPDSGMEESPQRRPECLKLLR